MLHNIFKPTLIKIKKNKKKSDPQTQVMIFYEK